MCYRGGGANLRSILTIFLADITLTHNEPPFPRFFTLEPNSLGVKMTPYGGTKGSQKGSYSENEHI
jgi:hypothetical protein